MRSLYSFFIICYGAGIRIFSAFNSKAALWVNGRKNWSEKLGKIDFEGKDVYWFHCSSLGEFEQGRPLIEAIKKQQPDCFILLSFFSPSGYEQKKKYSGANYIMYLPNDTKANAGLFIKEIKPKAAFFIKYEFWFNYLDVLKTNNINTYLVSGIFRPNHYFFKWYGKWAASQLKAFTTFFVQDQTSVELLSQLGYKNAIVTGDTRFDRVIAVAEAKRDLPEMINFEEGSKLLIAGSTWPEDEAVLLTLWHYIQKQGLNIKLVIAPHEVNNARVENMIKYFGEDHALKYSTFSNFSNRQSVLIIDNVGLLSSLYRYGKICYIGGGFGSGIHNSLEAAVYGKPVVFGPQYLKFIEAVQLVKREAAFSIRSGKELTEIIKKLIEDQAFYKSSSAAASEFVKQQAGATKLIMEKVFKNFNNPTT